MLPEEEDQIHAVHFLGSDLQVLGGTRTDPVKVLRHPLVLKCVFGLCHFVDTLTPIPSLAALASLSWSIFLTLF